MKNKNKMVPMQRTKTIRPKSREITGFSRDPIEGEREEEMLLRQPVAFWYIGEQLKLHDMGVLSEFEKAMRIRIIIASAFKVDQQNKQWSPADAGIPT